MADDILFLFNHDAPHQVAHIAGIARAMVKTGADGRTVTCAVATPAIRARVESILGPAAGQVAWYDMALPGWLETALALPNKVAPVRRLMRLRHHAGRINAARVVVSAERTCLSIREGRGKALFAYVPHGAGDRMVSYHPEKGGFDLILVSGQKTAREMVARGVAPAERLRVIGYPKFDAIDLAQSKRLFPNDNPVLVYNPHFDPLLSSWYDHGPALLDWFASPAGQAYNLIFAPHIMLFAKKLHVSLEYRTARLRPDIAPHWQSAANILIDTGSAALVDMTYTLAAHAYIGDVSSQVYEFLVRPRPLLFLDAFSHDPRSREGAYPAWQAGDVARDAAGLAALIPGAWQRHDAFRATQEAIFADTVSHQAGHPAVQRAAQALRDLAAGRGAIGPQA